MIATLFNTFPIQKKPAPRITIKHKTGMELAIEELLRRKKIKGMQGRNRKRGRKGRRNS